jgi:hypothetical protein
MTQENRERVPPKSNRRRVTTSSPRQAAAAYSVTAVPETYVIGPSGLIVSSNIGEIDGNVLAAQLDRLTGD